MITRNIITHLDFTISSNNENKQYIFENIEEEDDKYIILYRISLVPKNQYVDFKWPSSVTFLRNNNYVYTIKGITSKDTNLNFNPIVIHCNENWKIIFDDYDSENNNTIIYLIGSVSEPEGRNINL